MEKSILDEAAVLTKENFEQAIACGSNKKDLMILFGKTEDIEKWCLREYNMHFDEAYQKILRVVRNRFLETCTFLSEKGNATALNILTNFLMNYADNAGSSGITIINNIPGGKTDGTGDKN